jgi:hypothetical protein
VRRKNQFSETALKNVIGGVGLRGFFGGVILRAEGSEQQVSGTLQWLPSPTPVGSTIGKKKKSLLRGLTTCESVRIADDVHLGVMLMWAEAFFAGFGFDLIARMQGTFEPGRVSSFYGLGTALPGAPMGSIGSIS